MAENDGVGVGKSDNACLEMSHKIEESNVHIIYSPFQNFLLDRSKHIAPLNICNLIRKCFFCETVDDNYFEWTGSTWSEYTSSESSESLLRDATTVQRLSTWDSRISDLKKTSVVKFANPPVTTIKSR